MDNIWISQQALNSSTQNHLLKLSVSEFIFFLKLIISWNPISWISMMYPLSMNLLICILFARNNALLLAADRVSVHLNNISVATSERDREGLITS